MTELIAFGLYLLPWFIFFFVCVVFYRLSISARKRKGAALAIGLLLQMFLPDPKVEHTIEMVSEKKKRVVEKQNKQGAKDED